MLHTIENSTDCEIRTVICFLNAKDVKVVKIPSQTIEGYGAKKYEQWIGKNGNDDSTNVHEDVRRV